MTPAGAPRLEEILIQSESVPWREKSLKGVHEKMLWRDEETGASIALIKFDKGAGIPQPHYHASNQFMFCLKGRYEYTPTGVVLTPGCFYCNPKGHVHGPAVAREEGVRACSMSAQREDVGAGLQSRSLTRRAQLDDRAGLRPAPISRRAA